MQQPGEPKPLTGFEKFMLGFNILSIAVGVPYVLETLSGFWSLLLALNIVFTVRLIMKMVRYNKWRDYQLWRSMPPPNNPYGWHPPYGGPPPYEGPPPHGGPLYEGQFYSPPPPPGWPWPHAQYPNPPHAQHPYTQQEPHSSTIVAPPHTPFQEPPHSPTSAHSAPGTPPS